MGCRMPLEKLLRSAFGASGEVGGWGGQVPRGHVIMRVKCGHHSIVVDLLALYNIVSEIFSDESDTA